MKYIATLLFAACAIVFAIDVLHRATSVWGYVYKSEDAITLLVLAGVAAFIWGRGAVRGEVAEAQH